MAVLGFNLIGDGLQDVLDPRRRYDHDRRGIGLHERAQPSGETPPPCSTSANLRDPFLHPQGCGEGARRLTFQVGKGEIVGLVGESGSGKSVTGFSIVRLLKHPGRIVGGRDPLRGHAI